MTQPPPVDPNDNLDLALRRLARATHPRPDFVARLRGELSARTAGESRATWPARLAGLRPWLAQGLMITLLAGLVLASGVLTGRWLERENGPLPAQPAPGIRSETGTPLPGQPLPPPLESGLPQGALARLGKGQVRSLSAAADGRLAVGSTAGLCLYNTGFTVEWCRWTDATVQEVLFSPAGDVLAVRYTSSPLVEIWDASTGQVRASRGFVSNAESMQLPQGVIIISNAGPGLAWEPGGSRLAVASHGRELVLWDWSSDTLAWGPVALSDEAVGLAWAIGSEGQSPLAVITRANAYLYDGLTGELLSAVEPPIYTEEQLAAGEMLTTLALSPDGRTLALGTRAGALLMVDGPAANQVKPLPIPGPAQQMAFSPHSNALAVISGGQMHLLALPDGQFVQSFPAGPISPLVWRAHDNSLVYVEPNGSLAIASQGAQGTFGSGHVNVLRRLAWADDQTIVSGGGLYLQHWNVPHGELSEVRQVNLPATAELVGLSADGRRAGFLDRASNTITPWDVDENQPMPALRGDDGFLGAALAPDGRRMAGVARDGQIFILNILPNGIDQRDLTGIPGATQVDEIAFQPGGDLLAVAFVEGGPKLEVWDTARAEKVTALPVGASVTGLAWSPDGRRLAVLVGYQILVYDSDGFERLHTLLPEPSSSLRPDLRSEVFRAAAFSPDGAFLAAGSRELTVYDLSSGQIARRYSGHNAPIHDLAFRPDGLAIASAAMDGTILVWDLGAGSIPPAEPQPTATPLPLPDDPPAPMEAPTLPPGFVPTLAPVEVDLNAYDVTMQVFQSPYGDWAIEALRGEFTGRTPTEQDYNQFSVYGPNLERRWVIQEWPPHGSGEGAPARAFWSVDGRSVYLDDRVVLGGCGGIAYGDLRRLDLNSGQVTAVPVPQRANQAYYSISPDGARLAIVQNDEVDLWNLNSDQPEHSIRFEPLAAQPGGPVDAPLWSPDGARLAFLLASPHPLCGGDVIVEAALVLVDVEGASRRLDLPPGARLTGWQDAHSLLLVDSQGFERLLDIENGQLGPEAALEEPRQALMDYLNLSAGTGAYRLRWMSVPEVLSDQPGAERYRVWVELNWEDGTWLQINQETRFGFTLLRLADGRLHVMDSLPNENGQNNYAAHLHAAALEGLDEDALTRALVEEWLRGSQSPYLPPRARILEYEIMVARLGGISYSVLPAQMLYSNWVAGNGVLEGRWVRQKGMLVRVVRQGEVVHLVLVGTGP